jgi:exopolysaccharide biosynthesis polyprenyl glycosylphosphotransferase
VNEARRRFLLLSLKSVDMGLLVLSFLLATLFIAYRDTGVSLPEFLAIRVKLSNCVTFFVLLAVWHGLFSLCGLYRSRRLSSMLADAIDIAKASALSTACIGFAAFVCPIAMVKVPLLFLFFAFTLFFVFASRVFLKGFLRRARRRGRNLRYVLILGTNARAIKFARRISDPDLGYRILGFVDDRWHGFDEFQKTGFAIACDHGGLPEFLRRNVVDEVAMYLPFGEFYDRCLQAAALCEQQGIILRFEGDIFGLKTARAHAEDMEGDQFIVTNTDARNWGALLAKRTLDIVVSFTLLVLLSPLYAAVALLIWLSSNGPVFFQQARVGVNKRKFMIHKFRTMIPHAEQMLPELERRNEVSGPVFKIKKDPRITPIGRILRRTSIDELPQLINVLKGDMSLVGPRPLPFRDYEGFSEDWQRRRFSIRPGITCLWQVNGRSAVHFDEWMKLDLQYMDHWSLMLDLKILAQTIPAVLKGSGAA